MKQLIGIGLMSLGYVFHVIDTIVRERTFDPLTWMISIFAYLIGLVVIMTLEVKKEE